MRNLLINITSAWTLRNVVLSGLLERLREDRNVSLAFPAGFDVGDVEGLGEWHRCPALKISDRVYLRLRERLGIAHSWRASARVARYNHDLRCYRTPPLTRWRRAAKQVIGQWESHPGRYRRLMHRELGRWSSIDRGEVIRFLKSNRVDEVFFPAPEVRDAWVLARCAQELGLFTRAAVLSFDNLTTKGRHPIRFDRYLVWSERMKQELMRVYDDIPEQAVDVVGTPQFQFYYNPEYRGTRAELAARFDLRMDRPIVLYAGGPDQLIPHEVPIVERLAADVRLMPPSQRPQLLVRIHPLERTPERWEPVRQTYPEICWNLPWANQTANALWGAPKRDEIRTLCMLVAHSDVVINAASTMSIDAAVCDTPVVCIDYALPPFADFATRMSSFYDFDHYRPIVQSGAIRLARGPEQLVEHVRAYLDDRTLDQAARRQLVRDFCGPDPARAVDLIASTFGQS